MASPNGGDDFEGSLLSFEKLDRASPDLWPERLPGVAEFAASCKNPINNSPPKWMAELESEDIEMLKELGSLTTANLMEKVKGLQNLAYQLGLEECKYLNITHLKLKSPEENADMSERAFNASMIHRNPESLQLIGCWLLPLVGMDLLDKKTIF
ncbi:hypothetical protein KUCAC02_025522 [Chaenocephalus aceratus]|uniref:Uncharacterized protein n=1 Tax=Chaenocephalus aceratus TaxID=36190 RepID=A0ACB9VV44_CHAAC|nr:hypothetical protein KUCAC02_025522 [Chaenocephalus aceratus]